MTATSISVIERDWPDSSLIAHTKYDVPTLTLTIFFRKGAVSFEYEGVSEEVYETLANAPSIGKAFYAVIKPYYNASKVEQ